MQDKKEDGEAEEEEEEEVERFADRSAEGPDIPETARKLHGFLSHVETDNIVEDYRHKVRRWRFNISGISFQNDSDARMSIFLAFVVTDERPAKPWMKSMHAACCGKAVPLDDLRAITRFTQAIRCVQMPSLLRSSCLLTADCRTNTANLPSRCQHCICRCTSTVQIHLPYSPLLQGRAADAEGVLPHHAGLQGLAVHLRLHDLRPHPQAQPAHRGALTSSWLPEL